jgi:hypothetical protein
MKKRMENLLCIKSIVTLVLTGVFAYLSVKGFISPTEFVVIFTVIINFYFETQRNKDVTKEV